MQEGSLAKLAAPFPKNAVTWRIEDLSDDKQRARLRPLLRHEAVTERLNNTLGIEGWSSHYQTILGNAFSCALTIGSVTKSVVMQESAFVTTQQLAQDALVRAAEYYNMTPPVDVSAEYWVDYDAETGEYLLDADENYARQEMPVASTMPAPVSPEPVNNADAPKPEPTKPAGQQAIDRLVERLKDVGLGHEAAKLVITYGGYGDNAEAARQLYSKLRTLLVEREASLP